MSGVRPLAVLGVLGALGALGCSGPAPCEEFESQPLTTASYSGSAVLSAGGESATSRYRVTLSGLPELWGTSSPVQAVGLRVSFTERYTEGEPGGDGTIEMPYVAFGFTDGDVPTDAYSYSPYFPSYFPEGRGAALFTSCDGGACCARGSTGCVDTGTFYALRTGDAPFPPVEVSWELSAEAQIGTCPVAGNPKLELVPEDP